MPLGSRSDVYLVSATRFGGPRMEAEYDNRAYEDAATLPRKDQETYVAQKEFSEKPYRGMGKDELLIHSSKPFWRRLRMLFVAFIILAWLALIATVVALIIVYPRCKAAPARAWWQKSPVYRIYTDSFQDSDDDGVGDLNGIKSRLGYFKDIGVKIISISSIYESDGTVNDYSIVDHKAISNRYGTMDDFKALINATHGEGLYLIMDFIPNHTSDKHPWFIESKGSKTGDKRNYYVWEDEKEPSNWVSVYGNSAWKFDTDRNQSYLHQFLVSQPDLNLRNSKVTNELQSILKFWLDLGVDGFYVRQSAYLFEDYDLRDEGKSPTTTSTSPSEYDYYKHQYTYAQDGVYDILSRWRAYMDDYGTSSGRYRLLFADIDGRGDITTVMKYYHNYGADCTTFPLNKEFVEVTSSSCTDNCVGTKVNEWMKSMPAGKWPNWVSGLDDTIRLAERTADNFTRAYLTLSMLMPGTPVVYYGDEIGMKNTIGSPSAWERKQPMRAPMVWSNGTTGGFCESCTPWIDFAADVENMDKQNSTGGSLFKYFKELITLRTEPSFTHGDYYPAIIDDSVVSFVREWDGESGYLVAINFGSGDVTRSYTSTHDTIQETTTVKHVLGGGGGHSVDDEVKTDEVKLGPLQGIVLSWDFVAKDL